MGTGFTRECRGRQAPELTSSNRYFHRRAIEMKSKIRKMLAGGFIFLLVFGAWAFKGFLNHRATGSDPGVNASMSGDSLSVSSGGGVNQPSGPGAVEFAAAHLTPILFYGKVVDQDGSPIPDATVIYRASSIPWGGGIRSQIKTDAKGEFEISSRGLSLYVEVTKDSYRSLPRRSDIPPDVRDNRPVSSGTYPYAKQFGGTVHQADKSHPVVFTLHKSGVLEPLIIQPGKDLSLAKDGSPIRIELDRKSVV